MYIVHNLCSKVNDLGNETPLVNFRNICDSLAMDKNHVNPTQIDELVKKRRYWAAIQAGLVPKMMAHLEAFYGPYAVYEAFDEYHFFESEEEFTPDFKEMVLFMPWFLYHWTPDPESEFVGEAPPMPPAQSLIEHGQDLTDEERAYLTECCETAFSFFEVQAVEPGQWLKLKDLILGEEHFLIEKSGSKNVEPGNLFFGKIVSIDGHEALEATAPIGIPAEVKKLVLDLRRKIAKLCPVIDDSILHRFHLDLLFLYRNIYDGLMGEKSRH